MAHDDTGLGKPVIRFCDEGFARTERVLTYEMVNSLLLTMIEMQRQFAMRPLEFQIFMVIAMASVQRFLRDPNRDEALLDDTPLPAPYRGSISRRRIADTLDLPLETVRRHVAVLLERGAIIESGRGLLSTGGGTLRRLSASGTTTQMGRRFIGAANPMMHHGGARQEA